MNETASRADSHKEQPEPDKDEYFLIKQVDGKHTLDSISMDIGLLADLKIAQGHPWKPFGKRPIRAMDKSGHYVYPIQVVMSAHAQKVIQHEQLADDVKQVDALYEEICAREIIAVDFAAEKTAVVCEELFHTGAALSPISPVTHEVGVDLRHHVAYGLLSGFWIDRLHTRLGSFH